jgi:hypothetical protein
MIRAFHAISTLLLATAIGFFLFNLIWQYAAHGTIKFLSIEELWTSFDKDSFGAVKTFAEPYISADGWSLFAHSPAAVVLLVLAAVFYVPVGILMLLGAGKKAKGWRE